MDNLIKEGAFLVDVRTEDEFAEGHVNGSTNIPLDQVASQMEKFKGKEQIIVFCRSGNRSGQAKMILEQNGIKNVINGGTWQDVKAAVSK
jgi:phage shock protein E